MLITVFICRDRVIMKNDFVVDVKLGIKFSLQFCG